MARVYFYYYQSSPRILISHTEEMDTIPVVGDVICVYKEECKALNKKLADKNYFLNFKVVERRFRMVKKESFVNDVQLFLEPIDLNL